MEKVIAFNKSGNPKHSGIYIVDRGEKLGTPFRFFNVDTDSWSRCEYTIEDCFNSRDTKTGLGFLPWRGPVKTVRKPATEVALANQPFQVVDQFGTVATINPVAPVAPVKPVKPVKTKAVKVAKPKAAKSAKVTHPDGTIAFRGDRNKYMAWFGGKAEAARPTIEACKAFLTKKYNVTEFNIIDKE